MAKTRLDIRDAYDLRIIGLLSDEKEYKLAWLINKSIGITLTKREDLVVNVPNKGKIVCSYLECKSTYYTYRLIKNKVESGFPGRST